MIQLLKVLKLHTNPNPKGSLSLPKGSLSLPKAQDHSQKANPRPKVLNPNPKEHNPSLKEPSKLQRTQQFYNYSPKELQPQPQCSNNYASPTYIPTPVPSQLASQPASQPITIKPQPNPKFLLTLYCCWHLENLNSRWRANFFYSKPVAGPVRRYQNQE